MNAFDRIPYKPHASASAYKRIGWPFALVWLTALSLSAQQRAEVWMDTNQITIGDQAHLFLRIASLQHTDIKCDLSPWETISGLEITKQTPWDTILEPPGIALQKVLTVTSFDSGTYYIPPLVVEWGDKRGSVSTPEIRLEVRNPPVADLAPIREIVREKIALEDIWPYLLAVGLFLVVVYGISRWMHREKITPAPLPEPEVSHAEIAMHWLGNLESKQLWQKGMIREFETELTLILRDFLKKQFHIPALEATTGELLLLLQQHGFSHDRLADLRSVLEVADLVKFARAEPDDLLYDHALEKARILVAYAAELKK